VGECISAHLGSPTERATKWLCVLGVGSGSRDITKFWVINANISEPVQDRDIVTLKD